MWFWTKVGIVTLLVAMLMGAGYSELVLDSRTPRSALVHGHFVGTESFWHADDFNVATAAMKRKYGPNAETTVLSPPLRRVVTVDDKVVHEEVFPLTFNGALGLFVIGKRGSFTSVFPFRLDPQVLPPPHKYSSTALRERFADTAGARYLDFSDSAVAQGPCVVLAAADLGGIGKLLRIETGTLCIVDWSGTAPATALIGAALANGDPWMRPFAQRICRSLTGLALEKVAAVRARPPEYAACILVDRPTRDGAAENSSVHVFEVGRAAALAVIDPPEARPATTTALASPK